MCFGMAPRLGVWLGAFPCEKGVNYLERNPGICASSTGRADVSSGPQHICAVAIVRLSPCVPRDEPDGQPRNGLGGLSLGAFVAAASLL